MAKRIAVSEVVEAYQASGIKPVRVSYLKDGCSAGCALGALAYVRGEARRAEDAAQWSADEYGMEYVTQFWNGFDGHEEFKGTPGYIDGAAAWAAVGQL